MVTDEMRKCALAFRDAALKAGYEKADVTFIGQNDGSGYDYIRIAARTLEQIGNRDVFAWDACYTHNADSETVEWSE